MTNIRVLFSDGTVGELPLINEHGAYATGLAILSEIGKTITCETKNIKDSDTQLSVFTDDYELYYNTVSLLKEREQSGK